MNGDYAEIQFMNDSFMLWYVNSNLSGLSTVRFDFDKENCAIHESV